MEQQFIDIPEFRTIEQVADEATAYIDSRRKHLIQPLKTRWKKFNKACCGGIEPNMVFTIAGISGAGKSALANLIQFDLFDMNSNQEIVILNFSLEMIGYRNIGRAVSNKLRKTTTELYSADSDLSDTDYKDVEKTVDIFKQYNIYYVDKPCSVDYIGKTIDYFHKNIAKDKWLIVILDHVLLVDGDGGERSTIVNLQKLFIEKKKLKNTTIIQLSQMNRNIESPDRINNPSTHFPMRSDLSASDAMFQASDFVLVIHRPELLNLGYYGTQRLPVRNKVYLHFLKVRDGEPCILAFENDLKYGNLIETTSENN